MPRSNRIVDNTSWSLVSDLQSYYRGSVVTYIDPADGERWASQVHAIYEVEDGEDRGKIFASIYRLAKDGTEWLPRVEVWWDQLDLTLPKLGLVEYRAQWIFLQRQPARRMRKGYHNETITYAPLEGAYIPDEFNAMDTECVGQIWYGSSPARVTNHIVRVQNDLYYTTELIAQFNEQGQAVLIPGKERMGELACKQLLVNSSELQVVRPSVSTPASLPTTDSV